MPSPGHDRESPPAVSAFLLRVVDQVGGTVLRAIRNLARRTQIALWGGSTVVVFLALLIAGLSAAQGGADVLGAIFGSIMAALLVAAAGGWLLLRAVRPSKAPAVDQQRVTALEGLLADTLRELEVVRADIVRQVRERSVLRVPAGMAGAFLIWLLQLWSDDPPGLIELPLFVLVGALAGEVWALYRLDREYRRLYKSRVLSRLAAEFGDLTYQRPSGAEIQQLRAHRVFRDFERVIADDEIVGTYRGLPLAIREVRLERGSGKDTQVVFDGLLVDLTLPRSLTGTTAVIADEGVMGSLAAHWRSGRLQRVRLEDVGFEKQYDVYGSDQVEARALLTPAFIERFKALGGAPGFSLPGALAEGNRLMLAMPKALPRNLFEPPPYWKPAGGRVLVTLSKDIASVLRVADTVMGLDFWAAGVAGQHVHVALPPGS